MGSRLRRTVLAASVASVASFAMTAATPGCSERPLNGGETTGTAGSAGSGNSGGAAGTSTGGAAGTSTGGTGGTSAGGAAGSCGPQRLTESEAASIYTKYAFEVQPSLTPTTRFEAKEVAVEGLWGELNAQLFDVDVYYGTAGAAYRQCTFVTHACQVFVPAGDCSQFRSALSSALVANGAFYFSWGFGSGVSYSQIGKLTPDGTPFTRVVSPAYSIASGRPPGLVVQKVGTDIRVYRAGESSAQELGTLDDRGDTLVIVDGAGRPLENPLP